MTRGMAFGSALHHANNKRYLKLIEQGIVANSPSMLLTMASAKYEPLMSEMGFVPQTADNLNKPHIQEQFYTSDRAWSHSGYIAQV